MPRFAIKTPPQHARWSDILEIWQAADQIELFESAWLFDHFYPIIGDQNGPCLESWVTLTALSQATSRLRIGSMVNGMHSRHPAITAKMAATLDTISGGRLNLGLGAGWFEPEAAAYGIPLGSVAERMNRFDEAVEVIVGLLSQESTTFHGRYFNLEDAHCEPKGPQRPHPPIAIGGAGEKRTLRAVARWAQIWDALRTEPDAWRQKQRGARGALRGDRTGLPGDHLQRPHLHRPRRRPGRTGRPGRSPVRPRHRPGRLQPAPALQRGDRGAPGGGPVPAHLTPPSTPK